MQTAGARTTISLIVVGGIFGSSFLLVKLLVAEMPPVQLTAWRLLIGGLAITAVIAIREGVRLPSAKTAARAALLATLDSVVPNTLLAWAQIRIDSGIAALLISTMPLFTVLLALVVPAEERTTALKVLGLAIGITGVALVVGADAASAANGAPTAHLAVLLASVSNAAAVVYARSVLASEEPVRLSGLKLVIGAAIAMAVTGSCEGGHVVPRMGVSGWALLIALGLVTNGLGRTMYLALISTAGSLRASLVAYIVPAVAMLAGWLVLGERVGTGGMLGLATVAAGVTLVSYGAQVQRLASAAKDGLVRSRRARDPFRPGALGGSAARISMESPDELQPKSKPRFRRPPTIASTDANT